MSGNKFQKMLLGVFIVITLALAIVITILLARQAQITDQGIITNTGIIRIHTDPENITYNVYLDDTQKDIIDNRVNNIVEGEYVVKIQAQDYSDWEKKVDVRRGVVTDVYVKLYPNTFSIVQVTKTNIDKAFLSKDGSYIFYVVTNSEFGTDRGIWRLPIGQSSLFFSQGQDPIKIADLSDDISTLLSSGEYTLDPNNDNSKVLLKDTKNNIFFVLNGGEYNASPIKTINSIVNFTPKNVLWLNGSSNVLVFTNEALMDLNITTEIISLLSYRPASEVIFTNNNTSVYVYDKVLNELLTYQGQRLVAIDLKNISLPENISSIKLAPMNSDVIFITTLNGKFYYLNLKKFFLKEIIEAASVYTLMDISNDGTAAIFCKTDKSCYTFTAKENIALNLIETEFTQIHGVDCVTGFVRFSPQSTHIVYYDPVEISVKTVEPDGSNVTTIIQETGLLPFANFNYSADYLYVLLAENTSGTAKNNIYKVQLNKPD